MAGSGNYAGDVDPEGTWKALSEDPKAVLIDVRTQPEWAFVGLPDLSGLNKEIVLLSWQDFPQMQVNTEFAAQVKGSGLPEDTPIYLLCRSGQRSRSAAIALTEVGYKHCYNVAEGFEGPLDGEGHRGRAAGWKARGLPWRQS